MKEKKAKLEDMQLKETETVQIINDISSMKKRIKKLKPEVDKYSRLFHTKAEVEGLYQTLSDFADQNDLVISRIEKKQIKEVLKSVALAKADGKKVKAKKTQTKNVKNIAYYLIPVDFEIDGNFIGYIKFKRALSLSNKMLNFDKESIQVVKGDTTGAIKVRGSLTIVGLPNEFFKIIIVILILGLLVSNTSIADSHDKKQDIIEKAKEINKEIKKKQANAQANMTQK